ncbi:MAG: alkaline phosphatase family protein [Deltaproteobacteria bacterium]|nr:alkaline phosphatase family protein [Deltaproteobacteria bacterium]
MAGRSAGGIRSAVLARTSRCLDWCGLALACAGVLCLVAAGVAPATPAAAAASSAPATATAPRSSPARPRVLMLGIDAADVEVVTPLLEAGLLPNLKRLVDAGTMQVLHSHPPTRSPAVWTTIATGVRKETHGIYDYVTNTYYWPEELRTKEKLLTTVDMRKVPAIWNIVGDRGLTSVVVGWLSTWPAEEIKGALVAPYIHIGNTRQTTIKGSIYKTDAPEQTHDPKLFARLKPLLRDPDAYGLEERKRYYDELPAESSVYEKIPILKRYNYTASWSAARMYNVTAATLALSRELDPDLVMVYYQCPDSFGHRFWHFRLPEPELRQRLELLGVDPDLAPELKQRYGHAIDNCYQDIDTTTGELLQALGPGFSVMVMSDHGFGACQFERVNKNVPFDGGHRTEGLVILSGPAFKRGAELRQPVVEDLAPTALSVLGVPRPEFMEGRILEEALAGRPKGHRATSR